MTRQGRIILFLAGATLLAGLAVAACAGRGEPDPAYLESLRAMTVSQLLHEHKVLRAEEGALATRLAEAQVGDLPPTAREAAQRSLDDSLRTVQAKRRAVDHALNSGGYARSEIRYPVQQLVLRAEAAKPEDAPKPPATPLPAAKPATGATPAPAASPQAAQEQPAPEAKAPATPASPISRATANQTPSKTAPEASPASPAPSVAGQAQVLGVETARTPEGLEVRIRLSGKPGRKFFTMDGPPRIVLDLAGVAEPRFRLFHRTLGAVEAKALRLGWHNAKSMLRLVLDTDAGHLGKAVVEETPDGLVLRVAP